MKRKYSELEIVENFVTSAYNRFGNSLRVKTDGKFSPQKPDLGYSYRFKTIDIDSGRELIVYNVVCNTTGLEHTDYRIKLHELGHIYLGHLDGLHEELDRRICNVFKLYRGELIDQINKNCGIDFAEKLIEKVIDDPILNHSLHNIAMDMEVNTKILSNEDIEEMEAELTSILPDTGTEILEELKDKVEEEVLKKAIEDKLNQMKEESKIKLILPNRYHHPDGSPFSDELSYPEYLIMIIKNLDQFVKMLVSIKMGGSGDTQNISSEDVKNMLEQLGNGNASTGLDELLQQLGMTEKQPGKGQGQDKDGKGKDPSFDEIIDSLGKHDDSNSGGKAGSSELKDLQRQGRRIDHGTEERDSTDVKRSLGQITACGGTGCGNGPGGDFLREVNKTLDPVDEAIDEVIRNYKNKVVKREIVRDVMKNYNRGINRKVIAPSMSSQVTMVYDPKIVYLIDISGSMDTRLVDRILNTIAKKMRKCGTGRGLKYDIISWNTGLGEHIKDIDPKNSIPRIHVGGGTRLARGIKYFKEHYDNSATLVIVSDFEDYLQEWAEEEKSMGDYSLWGFNYGRSNYNQKFKNIVVKNFNNSYSSW
jgi:predicted metal-dependent peptidase